MGQAELNDFVQKAEAIYAQRLRPLLEPRHADEFVAIEPESGDYYLGKTLSEAMVAAHRSHPARLVHALRVGHTAALHFGVQLR